MKLQPTSTYRYQPETIAAAEIIKENTVCASSHRLGVTNCEPLIIILDSLLRYAKAHAARFESPIAEDGFCGAPWLAMAKGAREMLSADGGVAHECGVSTDSKDNGACESLFWKALEAAGFTEADL